jgi:hypothetical protein
MVDTVVEAGRGGWAAVERTTLEMWKVEIMLRWCIAHSDSKHHNNMHWFHTTVTTKPI